MLNFIDNLNTKRIAERADWTALSRTTQGIYCGMHRNLSSENKFNNDVYVVLGQTLIMRGYFCMIYMNICISKWISSILKIGCTRLGEITGTSLQQLAFQRCRKQSTPQRLDCRYICCAIIVFILGRACSWRQWKVILISLFKAYQSEAPCRNHFSFLLSTRHSLRTYTSRVCWAQCMFSGGSPKGLERLYGIRTCTSHPTDHRLLAYAHFESV